MGKERKELIKRNQEFVSLPMPDFEKMTNEQLLKRAYMLEKMFEEAFKDEDTDDDDDI